MYMLQCIWTELRPVASAVKVKVHGLVLALSAAYNAEVNFLKHMFTV